MSKNIVVTSYNPDWPWIFESEAVKIRKALGDNCLAVHHIGSTSVPGLAAKPKIDIIAVVRTLEKTSENLESIGFQYRGEYNIPLHGGFSKRAEVNVNLHVYEEGHPEIELNLLFRDYLRTHPEAREEYAKLKEALLQDKSSFEKNNSIFTGYNLGKDAFIRKIVKAAGFDRIRLMKCTHFAEWNAAKKLRQKYFFDLVPIVDPYTWTFDHIEHSHLILYQGVEIVGYAHIQFWPDQRAALRIFVIDEPYRHSGLGSRFLILCEQWLKRQGIKSIHVESRRSSHRFYLSHGYGEMPFNDPSGDATDPNDIAMAKFLEESESPKKITRMGVYGVAMKEGKMLLVRQKQGSYMGKLDFPGGGIEFGETPEQALRREWAEEVGMIFDSLKLIDNLTATIDISRAPPNETYTFYQIGMIYRIHDCQLIQDQAHGDLPYLWTDLRTLSEEQCSKLLWKYRNRYL